MLENRGHVNKRLVQVAITPGSPVSQGAEVAIDGKSVGNSRASCRTRTARRRGYAMVNVVTRQRWRQRSRSVIVSDEGGQQRALSTPSAAAVATMQHPEHHVGILGAWASVRPVRQARRRDAAHVGAPPKTAPTGRHADDEQRRLDIAEGLVTRSAMLRCRSRWQREPIGRRSSGNLYRAAAPARVRTTPPSQ